VARLPARFFRSFGTDGPLAAILTVCFQYKVAQSWRRFDFKSAGKAEQFVDMLRKVEARLTEESLLVRPTCYISSSLPAADADAVAKILVAKGAAVVESPDDASHRIEPDPAGAARDEAPEDGHFRQTERREVAGKPSARVHYWYYPDSYDEWLPLEDIDQGADADVQSLPEKSRWVVHKRWVDDLQLYNEFMVESDYEVELEVAGGGAEASGTRSKKRQRASPTGERHTPRATGDESTGEETRSKRRRAVKGDGRDEVSQEEWHLQPPGGAENDGDADEPAEGAMKLAQLENSHQLNEHNLVIRDISHSAPQANAEPTPAANGGEAGTVVRVPSEADWFDPTKLHEKEKIALPDFFNGKYPSKNSHTYRQYRGFMLDAYRKRPSKYLHVSTCRESLPGDVGAIAEVHRNLQQWGLINYPPNLDAKERRQVCDSQGRTEGKLDHLIRFDKLAPPATGQPSALAKSWKSPNIAQEMFSDEEGHDVWTDQETLTLLKALEQHKDDWDAVAAQLPNKTKEQCVTNFVRMAIEDPFLEDVVDPQLRAASAGQVPFIDSGNPLLGQLQFFCNAVHSTVAGAAAGAALAQLRRLSDQNATGGGEGGGDEEQGEAVSAKKMAVASSHALAAAVTRAKSMADTEERRVQLLVLEAVKLQAQKIELKIKHFKEIEDMMGTERNKVEQYGKEQERERANIRVESTQVDHSPLPEKPVVQLVSVTPVPSQAAQQQQQQAAQQQAVRPPPHHHRTHHTTHPQYRVFSVS